MALARRLAALDERVLGRWPALKSDSPRAVVHLLLGSQALALVLVLVGSLVDDPAVTAGAATQIVLTITGLVRLRDRL